MESVNKKRLVIGIDPGADKRGNIGFCSIFKQTEIEHFEVLDFFKFQELMYDIMSLYRIEIAVVEDSNINGVAFNRGLKGSRRDKQLRDLGKNQMISTLIIQFLKREGVNVKEVSPRQKGRKYSPDLFRRISGYEDNLLKKHQHCIDAYQLAVKYAVQKIY